MLKVVIWFSVLYVLIGGFVFQTDSLWPGVNQLPLGAEEAVQTMSNAVDQFRTYSPFFDTILTYLRMFLLVEFSLFVWHWAKWLLDKLAS